MPCVLEFIVISRPFGSYRLGKHRGTWHKGQNSLVKSSEPSWAGKFKKCVQYDFKFTPVYVQLDKLEYACVRMSSVGSVMSGLY